jgi:hypothetical protein
MRKQGGNKKYSPGESEEAVIFVEQFPSPAAAGAQWKNDVRKGRSVSYLSSRIYLGNTQSDSDLDGWLCSGRRSA